LICSGANGRFFEITRRYEIVWEYVNPYFTSKTYQGTAFMAHRYGQDYAPQFAKLPPSEGPAVIPPDVSKFKIKPVAEKKIEVKEAEEEEDEEEPKTLRAY
jgi:hypothetical protein